MANGVYRIAIGWGGSLFMAIMGLIVVVGGRGAEDALVGTCCWLIFFIAIAISGQQAKEEANKASILYIPQGPVQQVVHHTYVPQQAPSVISHPAPAPVAKPASAAPEKYPDTPEGWADKGRNLELARDWERAAKAYQKAGLYTEAGRIRQSHMEKEDSQVKINIDRIGHNIQDSVVMDDSDIDSDSK